MSVATTTTLQRPLVTPAGDTLAHTLTKWFRRVTNAFQAYVFEGIIAKREIEKFYSVFGGHIFFQTMRAGVELDLFSILRRRPGLNRVELARAMGIEEQAARVLLLGLVSSKILKKRGDRYYNTFVSRELLTKESPRNVISYVKLEHHVMYRGMPYFLEALQNFGKKDRWNEGLEAFEGDEPTLYQRLSHDSTLHTIFQDAMSELSRQTNRFLADNVDLSKVNYLVDIGGGQGTNIAALADANPHLRASVFDLPSVAKVANEQLSKSEFASRLDALPGNCFNDELPTNADAFLLSHFCTIWSAEKNKHLFKKCAEALPENGQLFVFNMMQNDNETGPLSAAVGSPYFLTIATGEGMLYTWNEYETWMRDAGFRHVSRIRLPHDHGVIVGTK
jgi:hypothetical protein